MEFIMSSNAQTEIELAASRVIARVTEEIAADARRHAPVDTAELQRSIEAHPAEGTVTVGTDHWEFQEYGTRFQPAQPFMRPALYKRRDTGA